MDKDDREEIQLTVLQSLRCDLVLWFECGRKIEKAKYRRYRQKTIFFQETELMNSEIIENKTDQKVEKMEQALRYAEGLRFYTTPKISPISKSGSMRVISQIKRKKLIG